ncbi:MAG: Type 1 glutamine amidotransferase-like domain-containing protein [Bacteriovoracaceae bacterium]|nr:Type 1 glutamine amidotransferase-like domain-containing protein [Bacteriovoracaceae bacterium]
MKLVFYGGGFEEYNIELDLEAIRLSGKKRPKVTYIPSCSYGLEADFKAFSDHYRDLGVKQIMYFPIDLPFDRVLEREIQSSDIIHLSGGNTFYFLNHLRKKKWLSKLKTFVGDGGVLTGLSAGGILMTPDIKTASYPSFDCDENEDRIRNFEALNLVEFEFFPHYRNSKRYNEVLTKESKKIKNRSLFASPDGSGLVVEGSRISFIGRNYLFLNGVKHYIKEQTRLIQ